jgi:hypothetical protein
MTKFILLLLFIPIGLWGQGVAGTVRDSTGEPVFFASVVAAHATTKATQTYTQSDENGRFKLLIPASCNCDSVIVTARAMGYTKQSITRAVTDTNALLFILGTSALKEIVIKAKTPPVVVRSDTTEYDAKAFSDSTEFNVEDLLKKIPGMQVSQNGDITLNGKRVERVLIEGDDLFSNNYTLATRNVRANMIGKVQAIEGYQENKMMKGIEQSDRLVLNLKFKLDKKRANSGSFTGGGGGNDNLLRGYAHTNLFSFTRTAQTYFIGNANNTGDDALSSVMPNSFEQFFNKNKYSLQDNPMPRLGNKQAALFDDIGLSPAFTQKNSEGVAYLGHVVPVSDQLKIKISAWGGGGRKAQQTAQKTVYFTNDTPLEINENDHHRQQNTIAHIQIESEYFSKSARTGWRSFIMANQHRFQDTRAILRPALTGNTTPIVAKPNQTGNPLELFSALEYTRKTGESSLFQMVSKTGLGWLNTEMRAEFSPYSQVFNLPESFRILSNKGKHQTGYSHLSGRWLTKKGVKTLEVESGILYQWGHSDTDVLLGNNNGDQQSAGNEYQNDLNLQQYSPFLRAALLLQHARWTGKAQLRQNWHNVSIRNIGQPEIRANQWASEPSAFAQYKFTEKLNGVVRYNYGRQLPAWADYYSGFVFTDYLSAVKGIHQFALNESHNSSFNLYYDDKIRFFRWNIAANWRASDHNMGSIFQLNPYLIQQAGYRPVAISGQGAHVGVSHFITPANVRLEIQYTFSQSNVENKVNSEETREVSNTQHAYSGSIGTAFNTWVNIRTQQQYTLASTANAAAADASSNTMWRSSVEMTIKRPGKKWYGKVYLYHIGNRFPEGEWSVNYGVKSEIYVEVPAIRSGFKLTGMNLPGKRQYTQGVTNELYQAISITEAVRPFVVLCWDYQF